MNIRLLARFVAVLGLAALANSANAAVLRFDMGAEKSAVAKGCQQVTAKDAYSAERGYGWVSSETLAITHENGFPVYKTARSEGQHYHKYFLSQRDPRNVDCVVSESDLAFRVDLPNGEYRVNVMIGNMNQNLGSISLYLNGELKEKDIAAWHPGTTGFGNHMRILQDPWGWWNPVRHTVAVESGHILIKMTKDQTYFDESVARQTVEEKVWEMAYSEEYADNPPYLRVGMKQAPYYYCGWAFAHNSIMALEIAPDKQAPLVCENDTLRLARQIQSPRLNHAIKKFNDKAFDEALESLKGVTEPGDAQAAKAIASLWLAGRLETEFEADEELIDSAISILKDYIKERKDEIRVIEILDDAETFARAWGIHKNRGNAGSDKNHFVENTKAIGWWNLIKEDSPLYYQAQLHIARAEHMLFPHFPARGWYREIAKELEKKFPDNRFVKYHLTGRWEQYGDGSDYYDWVIKDYTGKVKNSPDWVKAIYPVLQNEIDWCEWWINFKQMPIGSIGGGWSDDVEIVGAFGYYGYLGRDISDTLVGGTTRLVNGLWEHSVDQELGFSQPLTDAEHAAEETGNTLGMMTQIDYGNPNWVERSMKTAKLIRDLWTNYDVNGHRRFRSNWFCASRVGDNPDMAYDIFINYRAIRPALSVYWYNQNPTVAELITELADAWVFSAMSTEGGKPKGMIPGAVSFPEGKIRGKKSPYWHDAMPGSGYKPLVLAVLYTAFDATKNPKYLEPIQLEYDLAKKYNTLPAAKSGLRLQFMTMPLEFGHWKYDPKDIAERNKLKPSKKKPIEGLEKGTEEWAAHRIPLANEWLHVKSRLQRREGPLVNDLTKKDILRTGVYCANELYYRWPINTSEAGPTDRIAFVGFCNPFFVYTGGTFGGPLLEVAVTYDNTTRDFAAAIMANDPQGLRILFHSLTDDEREIGICPWHLEPGANYRLTYGLDADDDEKMDTVLVDKEIFFPQRGWPIRIKVKPNVTYLIEIDQTSEPTALALAPDPAITAGDIRMGPYSVLARIHNIGSVNVRDVEVAAYDGDPTRSGVLIGKTTIPNIEAPLDLDAKSTTIGFGWMPGEGQQHDIHIVIDPDGKLENEITTFNNTAHALMPPEI